jgi:hypothetical protein
MPIYGGPKNVLTFWSAQELFQACQNASFYDRIKFPKFISESYYIGFLGLKIDSSYFQKWPITISGPVMGRKTGRRNRNVVNEKAFSKGFKVFLYQSPEVSGHIRTNTKLVANSLIE